MRLVDELNGQWGSGVLGVGRNVDPPPCLRDLLYYNLYRKHLHCCSFVFALYLMYILLYLLFICFTSRLQMKSKVLPMGNQGKAVPRPFHGRSTDRWYWPWNCRYGKMIQEITTPPFALFYVTQQGLPLLCYRNLTRKIEGRMGSEEECFFVFLPYTFCDPSTGLAVANVDGVLVKIQMKYKGKPAREAHRENLGVL